MIHTTMADISKRCINLFYLTKLTETMETTISFCKDVGILPNSVPCPNCKKELVKTYFMARTKAKSDNIKYICHKKVCRTRGKKIVSLKTGTWFGGSHLSLQKISIHDLCICTSIELCSYC